MSKKKVLITGASGYLGARLCRSLLQDSYAVRALVRPTSDLTDLRSTISSTSSSSNDDDSDGIGSSLEISYGDITDLHSLLSAFSGCDVVFHTAALVEPWFPDPSCFSKEYWDFSEVKRDLRCWDLADATNEVIRLHKDHYFVASESQL